VAVGARPQTGLLLLDLKTGKVLKDYTGKEVERGLASFDSVVMTPNGKYLFGSNVHQMHRFRVGADALEYEETSGELVGGAFTGLVCDDALVCMPCGGGNVGQAKDHPPAKNGQLYVYPVESFKKPALTLNGLAHWGMAFDSARKVIYGTTGPEGNFLTYNLNGLQLKQYKTGRDAGNTQQIVVQPQGERLLLLADNRAALIDLPKK
jgi:hypothetical protein